GLQRAGPADRLAAVRGLADHADGVVAGQHGAQPGAHEVVVVRDQDARRRHAAAWPCGSRACRLKTPSSAWVSRGPPSTAARSRMPTIPCPPPGADPLVAVGLVTVISTASGWKHTATSALPRPCRAALVSASCKIR